MTGKFRIKGFYFCLFIKIFNYGRIYGAGKSFAEKLLLQFNPNLTEEEAKLKAQTMFDKTKGRKAKKQLPRFQKVVGDKSPGSKIIVSNLKQKWDGGTESEMFNKLEEIAKQSKPETPVLNASITESLEPSKVDDGVRYSI